MQGKRPIAQSKVVFVSLLVVDMLNTILQEIISKGDQVASARAAIVVFALLFGPLTVGHYVYLCIARKKSSQFYYISPWNYGSAFLQQYHKYYQKLS